MKHLHDSKSLWAALALFLALPGLTLLGQEEEEGEGGDDAAAEGGDAGGGSAAEAAVTTGGTSQPAAAVSGAIESNPIAALVRSGVPISDAIKFTPNQVTTLTRAGIKPENIADIDPTTLGSTTNADLLAAIGQVTSEAKYTTGFQTALENAVKIADAILTNKTITSASGLPDAITSAALTSSYNTELIRLLAKYGAIGSNGDSVANAVLGTDYAAFTSSQSLSSLLQSSTASYLGNLSDLGARSFGTEDSGSSVLNVSMSNVTLAPAANITIGAAATSLYADGYAPDSLVGLSAYETDDYTGGWEEHPVTFSSATSMKHYDSDDSAWETTSYTYTKTGANTAEVYMPFSDEQNPMPEKTVITFDSPNTGTLVWTEYTDEAESAIADGPDTSTFKLSTDTARAEDSATATASTIDVSSHLGAAATSSDRKVYVIGAAKDLTIAGDVTFTNTNTAEDHALVIGAADDLYLRGQDKDYVENKKISVTYEGSNLGIGSHDTMRLINVDLKTGGNLAIGTLDELHVGSGKFVDGSGISYSSANGISSIEVGAEDNVYLYAHNLLSVNGLTFSSTIDDIYMESITINLSNVTFPQNSDVMLRSRDGTVNFGSSQAGSVNFIEKVNYGNTAIQSASQFNGTDGHWDSTGLTLPNGKAAIKVRGF